MPQAKDYKTIPRAKPLSPEEIEQAKEARRRYYQEYRKRNPDRIKAAQDRYWLRKAQQGEQTAEQ
jgi:hypothetical protein